MKFVLVAALLLVVPLRAETEQAGIAAKVNDDVVTTTEVDYQASFFAASDLQGAQLETARQEYRQRMLQALIERKLILQAFVREGEKIPDGVVDLRLDAIIAENYGGDRNVFLSTIKARGISLGKYRQEVSDNWIITHMRQKHPEPGWSHSLRATADVTIY